MNALIHGHDEALAKWAAARIPHVSTFGACKAIGVATGESEDDKLLAVIVYNHYDAGYGVCEVNIAADNPRWATRGTIRALLSVPFQQFGCRKVYGTVPIDSARACKLIAGLGFRREAVLRSHFAKGRHAAVFGMLSNEYQAKWCN